MDVNFKIATDEEESREEKITGTYVHLPSDICWEIFSFLELTEILKFSVINQTFFSVANNNYFWKYYAKIRSIHEGILKLNSSLEENNKWKEAVVKFYLSTTILTYDTFKKEMRVSFHILGSKNIGKSSMIKFFFNTPLQTLYIKQQESRGTNIVFRKKIDEEMFTWSIDMGNTLLKSTHQVFHFYNQNNPEFDYKFEDLKDFEIQNIVFSKKLISGFYLLCFDLTDPESFKGIEVLKHSLKNIPFSRFQIVICGLKCDQPHKVNKTRLKELCEILDAKYYECSIKTEEGRENIKKAFEYLPKSHLGVTKFQRSVFPTQYIVPQSKKSCILL